MKKLRTPEKQFLLRRQRQIEERHSERKNEKKRWNRYQNSLSDVSSPDSGNGSDLFEYYLRRVRRAPAKNCREEEYLFFPPCFSIIEEPDTVLHSLENFVRHAVARDVERLFVGQHNCQTIDHGAASLLNAFGLEAREHRKLKLWGSVPMNEDLQDVFLATGLPRYMDVELETPADFETFPITKGRRGSGQAGGRSDRDQRSTELVAYLDRCLEHYGYQLQTDSERWLLDILGEVLTNADEHGGRGHWWMAGYLRKRNGSNYGDCHITIFNVGTTMAESLQSLEAGSKLRTTIEGILSEHARRGAVGKGKKLVEDNVWTLLALQQYVSHLNPETDNDRGQGTVRMIEFFQRLGKTGEGHTPLMCIVSGNTQIIFDGRYQMASEGEQAGVLAFNKENDLLLPPDVTAVKRLKRFFPGTLITMDFYIDPDNLDEIEDAVRRTRNDSDTRPRTL